MTGVGFDTNILLYLLGLSRVVADEAKVTATQEIRRRIAGRIDPVVPAQVLGEFAVVLGRAGFSRVEARDQAAKLAATALVPPTLATTMATALQLAADHSLQMWDSVIIAAASEAHCKILLSEDMQHGRNLLGLTIVNPLVEPMHPALAALASA